MARALRVHGALVVAVLTVAALAIDAAAAVHGTSRPPSAGRRLVGVRRVAQPAGGHPRTARWEAVDLAAMAGAPAAARVSPDAALRWDPTLVAVTDYVVGLHKNGWDTLTVTTSSSFPDDHQAYAAGYVEGRATYQAIWLNFLNTCAMKANGSWVPPDKYMPPKVVAHVQKNLKWLRAQAAARNATSSYWMQIGLLLLQLEGLTDGYNSFVQPQTGAKVGPDPLIPQKLSYQQMMFLSLAGDLMDLYQALNISLRAGERDAAPNGVTLAEVGRTDNLIGMILRVVSTDWRALSSEDYDMWFAERTHCSSLVKLTYDLSELYLGHATWATFNMLYRIYKTYSFNYAASTGGAVTVSFSGYPGALASIDDYYVTSAQLAVTETTFSVFNNSIYEGNIGPEGIVLYWMRVMVANRLASSGAEWTATFSMYNSGTYNNGWSVVDYSLFTPGQSPRPGTLWILEQFPGRIEMRDATADLTLGFWPGFNVPSFPSLFDYAGYPEAVAQQGWQTNSYGRNVRMQIFRRDQTKVVDLSSMKHMMQYNDYLHDPVSEGRPTWTVAARGDLTTTRPGCWGASDAKITSKALMTRGATPTSAVFSGPTPQQPLFDFATTNATIMCGPRYGLPILWDFTWTDLPAPQK